MSNKLFVGGIAWATKEDALRDAFEQFGEVTEAKIVVDHYTGRSRGFGFVTYTNVEDASKALEQLNGTELDGRTIRVDTATDKRSGSAGDRD